MKRVISNIVARVRSKARLWRILLAAAFVPVAQGAQPPMQGDRPAIADLDSIRTELLRQIESPAEDSAAPGEFNIYQWPNWGNWRDWSNWNNWSNWRNWSNW